MGGMLLEAALSYHDAGRARQPDLGSPNGVETMTSARIPAQLYLFNPVKTIAEIRRGVDSNELDEELRVILAFGKFAEAPNCIACERPVNGLKPASLLGWQPVPGGRNLVIVCHDCGWITQDEISRAVLAKIGLQPMACCGSA